MTRKAMTVSPTTNPTPARAQRPLKSSCPICAAAISYAEHTATFPFCSRRCRLADLGRWMNERYAVPCSEGATMDDDGEA